MKPWIHAIISAKKHAGKPDDYIAIHDFIDSSKAHAADMRQRTLLHSTFGCFLTEKVFGHNITNSEGKEISVRDIAEEHIIQDLGEIPTVEKYLKNMQIQDWMCGNRKTQKTTSKVISLVD